MKMRTIKPYDDRSAFFVPEGHPKIAQRFNAGLGSEIVSSPAGTAENVRIQFRCALGSAPAPGAVFRALAENLAPTE